LIQDIVSPLYVLAAPDGVWLIRIAVLEKNGNPAPLLAVLRLRCQV
jgi:hypothetical protein